MKHLVLSAVVLISAASHSAASTVSDFFSSFYSLGDSLTDDGKFGALDPPSFGGRFTNGLTWSEYIEDEFDAAGKDSGNFALGGATAGPVNLTNPGPLATLEKQIAAFQVTLPVLDPGSNPLVSLWFGANDIFQGFSPVDAANYVADGVRAIGSIVGQSFDDFLLINLPSIPGAPGAAEAFNAQLAGNILDLVDEGFNIINYDPTNATNAIVADFLAGSPLYGITDLTTPCTASLTNGDPASCLDDGIDPNTRLFVDAVHPNAVAHRLVAGQVNATVTASVLAVPLPASLPLLGFAFGGLVALARRRKAAA